MDIRPIRNEVDYQAALQAVATGFDNEPSPAPSGTGSMCWSPDPGYEAQHFPRGAGCHRSHQVPHEQSGLAIKDLEPMIGRSNRVYEVLNRRRRDLVHDPPLNRGLGIPAEVLVAGALNLLRLAITAAAAFSTDWVKLVGPGVRYVHSIGPMSQDPTARIASRGAAGNRLSSPPRPGRGATGADRPQ